MYIKVCGIRTETEARQLANLPIDYFGLIFAESKRKLTLAKAKKIADIFLQNNKKLVALVTLQELDFIENILAAIDFSVIQLHDNFDLNFCQNLHKRHSHLKLWRTFSVNNRLPKNDIYKFLDEGFIPLLDTKGNLKGGNGVAFDWQILTKLPKNSFVLAGGLSHENTIRAMSFNPYCLDFNSKLETANKKDLDKVMQVLQLVEQATKKTASL